MTTSNKDYTGGKTFFQWMTRSIIDKIYAFGITSAIIAGLIIMNIHGSSEWPTDDILSAYGLCMFFGAISWIGTKKLWSFPIIAGIMALLTYFYSWFGFIEGFGLFWLYVYWVGYYQIYNNLKKGISS